MKMMSQVNLKLVIIGDGACGKSALLLTYINKSFPKDYIPTVVDNYDVVMSLGGDRKLNLSVVDTAGQEDFKGIRSLSYAGTHVVVICYSCVSRASLQNVRDIWVKEIREADKRTPFVLVGNKKDLVKPGREVVTEIEAAELCGDLRGYASLQCSAKLHAKGKGGNVEQVFKAAIKCGVERLGLLDSDSPCAKCGCTIV